MSSLKGTLGTSISSKGGHCYIFLYEVVASSSHIALLSEISIVGRPLSGFDCNFPSKIFSIFQLLCRAALLLEINCTVLEKSLPDASFILGYFIQVLLSKLCRRFRSCFSPTKQHIQARRVRFAPKLIRFVNSLKFLFS